MFITYLLGIVTGSLGLIAYDEWRHWKRTRHQARMHVEQRVSEPAPLSPKVEREIAAILDGDDYEWVWRDAI